MSETVDFLDNDAWHGGEPRLSVLIPCYRHDASDLIRVLSRPDLPVEVIVLNDGSRDDDLSQKLADAIRYLESPGRLIELHQNQGRSHGRNRLAAAARARHLLFLDADMLPDEPDFLDRWIDLISGDSIPVAFGGYTLKRAPHSATTAVHRAMALHSDCMRVEARRKAPEKYLFTSNLLIRRDVFESEPFDGGFSGWGWEDVEWAIRVSRRFDVAHVEITASHLGLDSVLVLVEKYQQAAANFARIAVMHPEVIHTYPSYRLARRLKRAPVLSISRWIAKLAALTEGLPVPLRAFALRLYRTMLYAQAV